MSERKELLELAPLLAFQLGLLTRLARRFPHEAVDVRNRLDALKVQMHGLACACSRCLMIATLSELLTLSSDPGLQAKKGAN